MRQQRGSLPEDSRGDDNFRIRRYVAKYTINPAVAAVKGCRNLTKRDMKFNDALPHIEVDPETYRVTADGIHVACQTAEKVSLAQRYFLF